MEQESNKRGLKNRVPLSSTLDKELSKDLNNLAKTTRINKSKLLDEAIELLLKKYNFL